MLEFAKRAVVVGLGRSGIAAVRLLKQHGVDVVGTDAAPLDRLAPEVQELGVPIFAGGHVGVPFGEVDVIVVSPGVPALPEIAAAERAGVSAIGELELACRLVRAPMISVGGTNGKSTVTTLTALMLECSGFRTFSGGNLGTPLSDAVSTDWERLVVEVSSFQLERVLRFKPNVSILLNITEDHLDRYPSFTAYADAKGNAFIAQDAHDVAVVPFGDRACEEQARRGQGRLVRFGEGGDYIVEGRSVVETATGSVFSLESSRLHGSHNVSNAAASMAAARALGATVDGVQRAIDEFHPLGHRMAFVAEVNGVRYYDDSKGTNVGASVTALLGLAEQRGVLIAGGRDKQGSYEPLVDALRKKGRALIVIGEAADAIAAAANGVLPVEHATNMQTAVQAARQWAEPGDAVLLSPACSSFDMFKGYAERGDQFTHAVNALASDDGISDGARGTQSC